MNPITRERLRASVMDIVHHYPNATAWESEDYADEKGRTPLDQLIDRIGNIVVPWVGVDPAKGPDATVSVVSRPECIFNYCPTPGLCGTNCQSPDRPT